MNGKMEELLNAVKLNEILHKEEKEKKTNKLVIILAVIGIVAAIAAIAFAVYKYLTPDYEDDYDFEDDDFEDDFLEEDEDPTDVATGEPVADEDDFEE